MIVTGKSDLTLRQFEKALIWLLVGENFYSVTLITLKISVCIFFLRIIEPKMQRLAVYSTVALNTVFGIAYIIFTNLQCGAFSGILDFALRRLERGKCVSNVTAIDMTYAWAAISAATDLLLALMPILILRGANIDKRKKIVVFAILAMGFV